MAKKLPGKKCLNGHSENLDPITYHEPSHGDELRVFIATTTNKKSLPAAIRHHPFQPNTELIK